MRYYIDVDLKTVKRITAILVYVHQRGEVSAIQINTNCVGWDCGIDLEDSESEQSFSDI